MFYVSKLSNDTCVWTPNKTCLSMGTGSAFIKRKTSQQRSYLVLSGPTIRCHLVLPGPIWCHLVLSGPVWCKLVLSGPIWCNIVLSGPSLCYLVLSGPTWCYLVLSGPIWCSLVLNKEKYFLVKPLLRIHQAGWRSPPSQQGLNKQILFLVKTSSHLQVSVRTFLVKPLLTSSGNTPRMSSHVSKTAILRNLS